MTYEDRPTFPRKKLYRNKEEEVFCGVCAGIADYFDFSPWGVRLAFIFLSMFGQFFPLAIIYVFLSFLLKYPLEERPYKTYEDEQFWSNYETSRVDALRRVHEAYKHLDHRMQRMESVVTKPGFDFDKELNKS